VVGRQRLARHDVEGGTAEPAARQRPHQRLPVDHLAPGHVDQDRPRLHGGEGPVVEQLVGGLGQRAAHGHHVGGGQQVLEAAGRPHVSHTVTAGHRHLVQRQQAHAEAEGAAGHGPAGATEADDAHGQALELDLPGPHRLTLGPRLAAQLDGGVHLPGEGQQQGEAGVGQVPADEALLAGEDHVAVLERRVHEHVHPRRGGVDPLELRHGIQQLGWHHPQDHLGPRRGLGGGPRAADDLHVGTVAGRLGDGGQFVVGHRRQRQSGHDEHLHQLCTFRVGPSSGRPRGGDRRHTTLLAGRAEPNGGVHG
jgi:hypothetical protein